MKEKRKGFTLIELLAVIVVLAIIALIATPIVLNIIKSAKKGAFMRSAEGIVKSAKTYYLETLVNMEPSEDIIFICDNNKCMSGDKDLGILGNMGEGIVTIKENGDISLNLTNGIYTVTKIETDDKIVINNGNNRTVFTVIFDTTGGDVKTSSKKVIINSSYGELPTPTKDGYIFQGWYTEVSNGTKVEETTMFTTSEDQTLYAQWKETGATVITSDLPEGVKAIIYLDPTDLTKTCNESNSTSTTGTKSGCMKWYAYKETDDSYTMILDHNTTETVDSWESSFTQLTVDTSNWAGDPRLITGGEVADITGNTSWFSTDTTTWFYLDSNSQTQTATSEGASKYYWLYDYTYNCTSYGCKVEDSTNYINYIYGYWVSSSASSSYAWRVNRSGSLYHSSEDYAYLGVRPVITISKSNL